MSNDIQKDIKDIQNKYGPTGLMQLGKFKPVSIPSIPTGSIALDIACGIGGIPIGRITEIFGPESSGKTSLSLNIIRESQQMGIPAAFIDCEHALDPVYANAIGVDTENLFISQPNHGQQAFDIIHDICERKIAGLIVVDSVPAMMPKEVIDATCEQDFMGLHPRLMSKGIQRINSLLSMNNIAMIFINQIRMKIGFVLGNPETTPGGKALKFYSSMRMEIRKKSWLNRGTKDAPENYGQEVRVKVIKNKCAAPFKMATFNMLFDERNDLWGIDKTASIVDVAVNRKIIEKSGSWYSYNNEQLGQGLEKVNIFLRNNPEIMNEIIDKVTGE